MCGIVGLAGDITHKMKDGFRDLLLITQLRGRDATGAFSVSGQNNVSYLKMIGTPEILMDMKAFESNVMSGLPKVLAGHCRAKTIGENNRTNAHPYDFDNVIGMHNGTLKRPERLDGHDWKRTDSSCLYDNIDRFGIDRTMESVDPSGAWALVWWDKTENTLNFLRNSERPLWFAWTKDKRAMVWASEPGMFWAMNRREPLWDGKDEGQEPRAPYVLLPENELWSFHINAFAKKDEKPLTLRPTRKVVATGNFTYQGSSQRTSHHGTGGTSSGNAYQRMINPQGNNGGAVTNPFREPPLTKPPEVLDNAHDIGRKPGEPKLLLPSPQASTPSQGESPIIHGGQTRSGSTSSNVTDFRPESIRGMRSLRERLCLPSMRSNSGRQATNEAASEGSRSCTDNSPVSVRRKVSIRTVAGEQYITDNKTSTEFKLSDFEARTRSTCCFCKSPIGDISEVHEILQGGRAFICTSCVANPTAAAV